MIKTKFLPVLGFIFAVVASPSLWALQFAHPDGTLSGDANYTPTGAATNWQAVGEGQPFDDATFITASVSNPIEFSLGDTITDPGVDTGHIIKFRAENIGGKKDANVTISLYEGAGLIGEGAIIVAKTSSWTEYSYTLPSAAITTYNNLSIRLLGDGSTQTNTIISWVELEVPTASITPGAVTSPTFANVTDTTATLGANVTDPGTPTVTDRGVEWGLIDGGPYANSVAQGTGGIGIFTVPVTGLPSSSDIFFRAWADNGIRVYSAQNSFTTNTPASPPTVTSSTPTGITDSTATLGGEVTASGGATVTDRGVVWDTVTSPETAGTVVSMGSGLGPFSATVGSLPAGNLIYFKAYAANSAGTSYGGQLSFTTLVGLPTVDTPTVTNIAAISADLGGTVSSDGGAAVTDRGIVWNTTSPPETAGTMVSMGLGLGIFSLTVNSLPTGTLVHFRAFATNSTGTAYSSILSFTPAGPPIVTSSVANITHNSAELGGNVTSDGGSAVNARGIVWNTTSPAESGGTVVPLGSGLGIFSQIVSLPSATLIYFRAYATNDVQTGYSAEGSFTTASEPTVQASLITFPNTAGRSMRISWTRGNGDGSIVVMRLGVPADPGIQAPADGSDYAANADYTLAPQLVSSGNFVVYKGSGNFVLVTGLVEIKNYSVAIYEYAGIGAGTDYLQLSPAEGNNTTTDTRVHNEDNRVNCSDCHSHGSWSPNNAGLKDACVVCHTALGEAGSKLMFDNHLTPSKNPAIDVVACGACHELHNPGGTSNTSSFNVVTGVTQNNKSFLRSNVDKYVSTASPPAYLHTDQPLREAGNPNSDPVVPAVTPDRAVEGGTDVTATPDNTQATGYCQICHSLTNNHRSTNTAGSDQNHDGESSLGFLGTEVNCGTCHQHKSGFQGIGGSVTCVECHNSAQDPLPRPIITTQFDRLSSHIKGGAAVATQEDCMVCHNQGAHQSQVVSVWDADDGVTSFSQLTAGAPTTDPAEGEQFEGHCLSCHDDGSADSLAGGAPDQTPTSPFTGSAAPPIIDEIAWASAAHNRSTTPIVSCVGACHGSGHGSEQLKLLAPAVGAAVSPTDFCYTCHDGTLPPAKDIQAQFNTATNFQEESGASGALINQRHDITAADQAYSGGAVSCKDCHSPHVDNATNPVSDPDTNLPLATYAITNTYTDDGENIDYDLDSTLDPINPQGSAGGFTEPDYIQFCLTCHDNSPSPTSATMSPSLLDMGAEYATDYHGAGTGSGQGTSLNKGALKTPWTATGGEDPIGFYAAMNCTTCHGAHGSPNIFNLRSSITVAGVQMSIGGTGNMPVPARIADPTVYTLPPIDGRNVDEVTGVQTDHYWGAWCSFCHDMSAHAGKTEGDSCQGAHEHGGGSF